jgi:hypothetical protein
LDTETERKIDNDGKLHSLYQLSLIVTPEQTESVILASQHLVFWLIVPTIGSTDRDNRPFKMGSA